MLNTCMHYFFLLLIEESTARFQRLQSQLQDPMTELYLLLFSNVMQYFTRLNQLLQREEPIIGIVYEQVKHKSKTK